MATETQIAWLAGMFDGEGSFVMFKDRRGPHQVNFHLNMSMTCEMTMQVVRRLLSELAGYAISLRPKKPLSGFSRRLQYTVDVSTKLGCHTVLSALRPHLVTKAIQADLILVTLSKAILVKRYEADAVDWRIFDLLRNIKKGCGEAYSEAEALLAKVIPCQAAEGKGSAEGVETRGLSPNNNGLHECPAPFKGEDIVRTMGETLCRA